jgi:Pilus formation protein N terminal region
MTAFCLRAGQIAPWLLAAVVLAGVTAAATAAEPISVHLDQAKILKLPERAATVVIGDPLIADLSIQPGGLAVVTGKAYGATNVVVLDKSSAVLMEKTIEVKGPADEPLVAVYRGLTRQTYSCTPDCSPRVTLGDTSAEDIDKDTKAPSDYFNKTLNQAVTRANQATAAGSGH